MEGLNDSNWRAMPAATGEPEQSPTAEAFQSLGDDLAAQGRLQEAIESYKQAVRMEGDNPDRHTRLGDAYVFAENSSQALTHYRRALQVNPHHADTHFSLAEVYRRFGKLKGAITLYRKAI